ncbi:LOW QUALITY PROTEIN: FACT complex subunit Ssrp1-like [Pollicipes pollicipes]|uniref:LOW QUALITY PROTEIN: FACT complex subunit Ssrp1-like n=1 Tax=Pollicipes pollicipes TaxID=41117 RepID=UPI0018852570|nr:LOW QUALITY PROTEIN: FACT complex subunit Ssrp1-like [Pollicipes pollicipes]
MDFLEYNEALCEQRGAMLAGKLRVTDRDVIFKYRKTGKTEQFPGADIELLNWQRLSGDWGLRVFLKNGDLYRFGGFKDSDQDKVAKFFQQTFGKELAAKQMSLKGWNWGSAVFKGNALSFDVEDTTAFELPLSYVSQCTAGKSEVTLEFHHHDDAVVSLMEMRFHLPPTAENTDPTEAFQDQVMKKASVVTATGDVLAIFREVKGLTPRGRYDIGIYPTFINMHGKTFDFKIPFNTILRLFLLPHRDGRQTFFVLAVDPPIKQGMTRYHFLILRFDLDEDDEMDLELPISDEDLKTKYEGRLPKEMKGQGYEVLSRLTKGLANKKLMVPGSFKGNSSTPAVACSYKAAAGYLYPLERGFMYIHKPPIFVRFEEILSVNFARSGGGTRTFDFEIQVKNDLVHTFSSIEKEEYGNLFSFVQEKKIRIKSKGGMEKGANYMSEDSGDAADPYLERMKREGEERDEDDPDDEDESTDEDFNPEGDGGANSDVAEEFESNPESTESEGGDSDDSAKKAKKLKKKEKKEKREKKRASTSSNKPAKRKKKDTGAPKRPMSAYFIWLNEHREQIKEEHPGISVTEVSKKAGEMWRELKDKSEWEKKNQEAKARYEEEMKEWRASGGAVAGKTPKAGKSSSPKKSISSTPGTGGGAGLGFKSKEYISDSGSSEEDSDERPLKNKASKGATKGKSVKKAKEEDDEEEEAASTPASSDESGASGDDSD